MRAWTTQADIKAETERLWRQDRLLAALLQQMPAAGAALSPPPDTPGQPPNSIARVADIAFPYRLRLRGPRPNELGTSFEVVRIWVQSLERASRSHAGAGFDIEWHEVNTRALGRNRLPATLFLPSLADALALVSRQAEADRFRACAEAALSRWPVLAGWLGRRALLVQEHEQDWSRILDVVGWMVATRDRASTSGRSTWLASTASSSRAARGS
jgi:hypothetical protein